MPKVLKRALVSLREMVDTAGPLLLLALALLAAAYFVLDPTPPRRVVLATGTEQGAYAEFGKRYADAAEDARHQGRAARDAGRGENLALLRDANSGVDLAFVQGGADDGERRNDARRARRRPGVARQHVLRAGVAVLSRGLRPGGR